VTAARPLETKVALFCGGRGSATLIRELLRWPNVKLTLLVNAYDDGLSTGALRNFIPGMLGPSDFRKNLSYLLDLYSPQQYAFQHLLEHRLPQGVSAAEVEAIRNYASTGVVAGISAPLDHYFGDLSPKMAAKVRAWLSIFFAYAEHHGKAFEYADCSVGNLIFAGAYLETGGFNAATRELAALSGSQADLVNVSKGECRSLVALKADGTILINEAEIVSAQSAVPIHETYFMDGAMDRDRWAEVAGNTLAEKDAWLKAQEVKVEISDECRKVLTESDVILYGPGTQHSSLLPSYRIADEAIRSSPARIKLFVCNLHHDLDIQSLDATGLIDRALFYLRDPGNSGRSITHVLYNRGSQTADNGITLDAGKLTDSRYKGALIVEGDFQNPIQEMVHSGHRIIRNMLELVENDGEVGRKASLDIYVDLLKRSLAHESLLQEFGEIDWAAHFGHVRLRINGLDVPKKNFPDHLTLEQTRFKSMESEVGVLVDWLNNGTSQYFVTITGDGEYRLRDVLVGINLLRQGSFGVVYGSRTQSRRQFIGSLRSAYGEGSLLYVVSWLGAFAATALFSLRFQVIFSDPLTGFRLYQRSRLGTFADRVRRQSSANAASMTRLLIQSKVEIAEIPVGYRTFTGFTRPSWRFVRGLRNLLGIVR
jgi:2-phospho-L-lactate transferase/gluconeogenesis factor (CofD/UPF0052 family)